MKSLTLAGLICAAPWAATAQCALYHVAFDLLTQEHGESFLMQLNGVAGPFQIFADQADQSWTVLRVGADGLACIVAEGVGLVLDFSRVAPAALDLGGEAL